MCGIAAVLGASPEGQRTVAPAGADAALLRLAPRGPDGEGRWTCASGRAWLGHRRLAIVDVTAAAAQPFVTDDARVALVCNGEIYNAPTLRRELEQRGHVFCSRSDNEVLLHGYREWGERELLRRAHGMFAFVLWDAERRRAVLAVDHAGMKPLYYAQVGERLFAASDADALRALLPQQPAIDPDGLAHVLTLGYCPPPGTVWRGVHKLQPGRAMVFHADAPPQSQAAPFRHWSPPDACEPRGDVDAAFAALWPQVVGEHLHSDVPTGLLLSAGVDSTAVALAAARRGERLDCTTLSLPGQDDEAPLAAHTAARLGLTHHRQPIELGDTGELLAAAGRAFDEPQAYGALLTMLGTSRAARRRNTVVLTGDGGDEAFGGYTWHHREAPPPFVAAAPHERLARAVQQPDAPAELRRHALAALGSLSYVHGHLQRVFPRFHPAEARALLAPLGCDYDEHRYAAWLQPEDVATLPEPRRAQRLDLAGFCAGSILPKVDRASMAVGLEARCPLLDRRVLDCTLANGSDLRDAERKGVLRRMLAGNVPDDVLTRPKQGFSLRLGEDVWRQRIDWLQRSRLVQRGALCADWQAFVAPDAPSADARVFALCMLAAWAEERL